MEKGVDAACVLEYDLDIDEREEIVYAGFQTFRDLVTVKTKVGLFDLFLFLFKEGCPIHTN